MPDNSTDPSSLEGDALINWYRRSPQEIELERQAAQAQRYDSFFGNGAGTDPAAEPGGGHQLLPENIDPEFTGGGDADIQKTGPGFTWVPAGPNRWRGVSTSPESVPLPTPAQVSTFNDGAILDRTGAGSDDGVQLIDVGNPANRGLRAQYERVYGRPWPRTPDGRNFHVSHKRAIADGGTNTLDNIEPMHPDEHVAMHAQNGDGARWGRRSAIARAFGGKVEPPRGRIALPGLGSFSLLSDLTGLLSDRIRSDSFSHFGTDMLGLPPLEYTQPGGMSKWRTPDCPPGYDCV